MLILSIGGVMMVAKLLAKEHQRITMIIDTMIMGQGIGEKLFFLGVGQGFDIYRVLIEASSEDEALEIAMDNPEICRLPVEVCHYCQEILDNGDDIEESPPLCYCNYNSRGEAINTEEIRILCACEVLEAEDGFQEIHEIG
jgi:hypothetical protein